MAVVRSKNGGIQRSVATRKWKYVYNGFDYDELYDLEADPGENRNLASDSAQARTTNNLHEQLISWYNPANNHYRPARKS